MRDENEESEAVACPQQLHPCGIQNIPGTHCIKYSHPGLGGARPDIDVAEDVHSSQQAVEKPPAARLGHNICLLGPQPEGHEQPVDPCREKRLKFSKPFPGEAANSLSSRSITGLTLGWGVGERISGLTCHSENPEGIEPGKEHQGQDAGPQHPCPPEQQAQEDSSWRAQVSRLQQAGEVAVGHQSPGQGQQGQPCTDTCMGTGAVRALMEAQRHSRANSLCSGGVGSTAPPYKPGTP